MKKKIINETLVVEAIAPFDKENKEDLNNMKFKFDTKREIKIVDDKVGKGSLIKSVHLSSDERRFLK